jgi:hypothetical protein
MNNSTVSAELVVVSCGAGCDGRGESGLGHSSYIFALEMIQIYAATVKLRVDSPLFLADRLYTL